MICVNMKSIKHIRFLTYAAISMVFLLQCIWMINAYKLTQEQLSSQINNIFTVSVNRELIIREKSIIDSMANEVIGISVNDYDQGIIGSMELLLQDLFARKNHLISLHTLDTIFHSEIAQQKLQGEFIINRLNPETGEVLETTDPKGEGRLQGAMESEIIPIRMDGSEGVQVLLMSPYRAVFRQMLLILVLSLLLILFVGYALFYLLRSFRNERKLRQLQADFSHALTHNMATPLQTIYQVNAMMKNDHLVSDSEKRNKYVEIAQQQILNLQALTDRILTVARAEQSSLSPDLKPTDITHLIRDLTDKFSVQAKKEVHFSIHFLPDLIIFNVDESMLHNAISNLIDNAIKYSDESVEIETICQLKQNGLHIGIKDNGYGISSADQHSIFKKFERGKAVKRKEATGFGLGLSYVKSVTEAHLGTVNLFSKVGKGTLFELFFPYQSGKQSKTNDIES